MEFTLIAERERLRVGDQRSGMQFIQNCEYPVGTRRAVSAVRAQAIYVKLRLNK